MVDEATPLCQDSKQIPPEISLSELGQYVGVRRIHIEIIIACLIFTFAPAATIAAVPLLLEDIKLEYGVDDAEVSIVSGGTIGGSILGVLIFGIMCDKVGRHLTLMMCLLFLALGGAMHLLLPVGHSFLMLVALRIALGIPYGGLLTVPVLYLIEFLSDDFRGIGTTTIMFGWRIGGIYSIRAVAYAQGAWRLALAASVPVALISLALLAVLPETPSWLLVSGRHKEAQQVLNTIFTSPPVWGSAYIGEAPHVSIESSTNDKMQNQNHQCSIRESMVQLFSSDVRRTTLITCFLYVIAYSAYGSAWTWGPLILEAIAGHGTIGSWVFAMNEASGVVGTLLVMASLDYYGRKPLIVLAFLLGGIICVIIATRPAPAYLELLWLALGLQNSFLWSPLMTYVAEVFPTTLRGSGTGLANLIGRVSLAVVPALVGKVLEASTGAALHIICMMFFSGAAISFFISEDTSRNKKSSEPKI